MLYPVLQDPLRPIVSSLFDRPRGASIGQMLFGAGEQGGWYDVADMSTLFQDSAGATPVTAVEQQVGRMLDKSGRGNHATQVTATKRPIYSRRVNLLTKTDRFMDAPWSTTNTSVTPNAAIAPDGSLTAAKIVATSSSGQHVLYQSFNGLAGEVTITAVGKAAEAPIICIRLYDAGAGTGFATYFNLLTGTVGTNAAGNTATITPAGNGYYTCTVRRTALGGVSSIVQLMPCLTDGSYNYVGDGASGIFLWRSYLTLAIDAHLPYQRVNTATDYDADPAKFPAYLRFDGVDDALQTGNIDFTSTDKMTVLAGYAKLNDGPTSVFLETGVNYTGGGGIGMFPSDGGSTNFGSAHSDPSGNKVASIVSAATEVGVVTVRYDLQAGEKTSIRKDSGAWSFAAASGGGMLGNRPLHIGARAGTSLFFNGRLYSLIVRGAQTPLSQIQTVESYIKQKMRLP